MNPIQILFPQPSNPARKLVEIHVQGCECRDCEPHAPSAPAPLGFVELGRLSLAGTAVGTGIAFAVDPHGAWWALTEMVRSWGL